MAPDETATHDAELLGRREFVTRGAAFAAGLGILGRRSAVLFASPDVISLGNETIAGSWSVAGGVLRAREVIDQVSRNQLAVPEAVFALVLADGTRLDSTQMRIVGEPAVKPLRQKARSARAAERFKGRYVTVTLEDDARRLRAEWRAELRDGSRYLRQEVTLHPLGAPLPVREIALVDLRAAGAEVTGTVRGSPVAIGQWFVGFEHPLSENSVEGDRVRCVLARELPLRPESPVTVSSVIGTARAGQRRRDFLQYVERERAHPYRTFLHYNSWYDIGYFSQYNEADALGAIHAFGTQLVRKRGVVLDSFLFDDGWDDPKTLWGFHAGFPNGFARVRDAAARYGAAPGVWMSPWGGYGEPKKRRLEFGREQGFETNEGGFALSGPKYYERFRDTCFHMLRDFGVNQFKFDGTGNASRAFPGSVFDSDFDAALALIGDLRAAKPDLYVNLTTGTYPSPFWLRYADSIWRGGEDHDFAGVGTSRQQWITYRDGDTYEHVVRRGALYPLNALMLHGLVYARHAQKLETDPHGDFSDEIRTYFGTGTQLQEMYVTPTLTSAEWDTLAEAAKWSRRNAATLVDTHWLGGDPKKLEVYGWASWSPEKGIVTLRNPSAESRRFALDVANAFELPDDASREFTARSPWRHDRTRPPVRLRTGSEHVVTLAPFEVVTLEATPMRRARR
ncbi:MAG TPA: enterotoxin [Gemmatimonadaceae bacterium]|nr:enterotoxin [Gemmatimonadaceae bacterium]